MGSRLRGNDKGAMRNNLLYNKLTMKNKSNVGISLLETLVSLFLLSLILLGLDAMEIHATRQINNAWLLQAAVNQLDNMTEWLHVNAKNDNQIAIWNTQNALLLPAGKGDVTGGYPFYTLTVFWGDQENVCEKNRIGESGCLQAKLIL